MADGVYNGMPAGELPDLEWRLATGVGGGADGGVERSEEHTSELQSRP